MTERPILFSGAMVRAILAGTKTQTRRVVKQPSGPHSVEHLVSTPDSQAAFIRHRCPYGAPGDRLWVRETFAGDNLCGWVYRADHPNADIRAGDLDDGEQSLRRWTPAIHMPREACRLKLEITAVRVERLQDISQQDAKAEGCEAGHNFGDGTARTAYAMLWDSLNAKRGLGWAANPWVWVVEFRKASA